MGVFSFDPEGLSHGTNWVLVPSGRSGGGVIGKQVRCEEVLSGTLFADPEPQSHAASFGNGTRLHAEEARAGMNVQTGQTSRGLMGHKKSLGRSVLLFWRTEKAIFTPFLTFYLIT